MPTHAVSKPQNNDVKVLFEQAGDYEVERRETSRSAARHELMRFAKKHNDIGLWHDIARHLVDAFIQEDLTPSVSDHFVDDCPSEVFSVYKFAGPHLRFRKWKQRAERER